MLIDARTAPPDAVVETDVCIVGAGAAGISLAREFTQSGLRVAMLESGGLFPDQATQNLYAGKNIGRPYWDPQDTQLRLRYFGGATNHWGGRCAMPDALDFEERNGVAHSGWPFALSTLRPWYARAQTVCELGEDGYAASDWDIAPSDIPQPFNGPHFMCQALQNSPPTLFGKVYREALTKAPRLAVYLNANALRFETSDGDDDVRQLHAGTLSGARFTVRAKIYVLATGAIENARMLLLSAKPGGTGLGNRHDLVGRYFMVHLEYSGGVMALANPFMDFKFSTVQTGRSLIRAGIPRRFETYLCLSEETRRAHKLPHLRIFIGPRSALTSDTLGETDSVSQMAKNIGPVMRDLYGFNDNRQSGQSPLGTVKLQCTSEQMPNPDSRITLGKTTDAFGLRTVQIDWRLTSDNKKGVAAAHRLLATEIGRAGFGRLRSTVSDDDTNWPADMYGDEHNMGTTRMHRDQRLGVVDENCRVHGVKNLYVAGSSVFPTAGAANPTLTIVALALRLADHIKERLS